jgi:hypothetical protein
MPSLTRFPNGVSSFGVPVIGSTGLIPPSSGNYYFVSSATGSNSNDGSSFSNAFATVAYAIGKTTAKNGDVIVMAPYHTESIAAAGGWTPVAGSSIVGLGWGSARPLITLTATTSTIACSAANVFFSNFVTQAGISEIVSVFAVSAADVWINAVDYVEDLTNNYTCISWLVSTAAANRLIVSNCKQTTKTAPSGTAGWITLVGGDSISVIGNNILLSRPNNATAYVLGGLTTLTSNILVQNNILGSLTSGTNLIAVSLYTGTTGVITDNRGVNIGKTAIAGGFALASCAGFNNYTVHTANKSGLLDPVVDS